MTPPRQEGVAVRWRWCSKNRVWSIRSCGHSKCGHISRLREERPTGEPTVAELGAMGQHQSHHVNPG